MHVSLPISQLFLGYYMTYVDYCFEGLVPMYVGLLISSWFRLSTVAVASTIMLVINQL